MEYMATFPEGFHVGIDTLFLFTEAISVDRRN